MNNKQVPRRRRRRPASAITGDVVASGKVVKPACILMDERGDLGPVIRLSRAAMGTRDLECLEDDLMMLKRELKQEKEALREAKTNVARLESELMKRDKSIEILLSRRYPMSTSGKEGRKQLILYVTQTHCTHLCIQSIF